MKLKKILSVLIILFSLQQLQAQTLTLQECKEMAAKSSMDTKNAAIEKLIAGERKKQALWAYFPSVSVMGLGYYAFNPLLEIGIEDVIGSSDLTANLRDYYMTICSNYGIDPTFKAFSNGMNASVGFTQPVFVGGKIVNSNKLAAIGYKVAALQEGIAQRDVANEVEKLYLQIISLEEKYKSLVAGLEFLDELQQNVSSYVNNGIAVYTDLRLVEQNRNKLLSDKVSLNNAILLSKMNLCNLIGQEYAVIATLADEDKPYIGDLSFVNPLPEPLSPENYYRDEAEICANMKEIQLLGLSEEASILEKKIARADALPQIAVGGSYGYGNLLFGPDDNGLVYAMVKIPLTDWGKTSHKIREYEYRSQQASNQKEYLSEQLILKARKLWFDLTSAWEQLQIAQYAVETSKEILFNMEKDYEGGIRQLGDVLQARIDLRSCEDALVDAEIAYQTLLQEYLSL